MTDAWDPSLQSTIGSFAETISFPLAAYPPSPPLFSQQQQEQQQQQQRRQGGPLVQSYSWAGVGGEGAIQGDSSSPDVLGLLGMMPRSYSNDSSGSGISDVSMRGRREASVSALLG
ncbi:MAG: hypothetical protein WDW36_006768 [Sanguina aurantia]